MASTDFPELLKALRRRRDLTQEQLAREIGVSFSTVNLWENGRRRPQPFLANKIFELALSAGLDPKEFKDGDDQ